MIQKLSVCALLMAAWTTSATASEFRSVWIVEPKIAGAVPGSVRNGEVLFTQRLLPLGLLEITSEVRQPKLLIPKGTQFYKTASRNSSVFCSVRPKATFEAATPSVQAGRKHICILDQDGDGRFEGYFERSSSTAGLPIVAGKIPRVLAIADLATAEVPLSKMADNFIIGVKHDGKPMLRADRRLLIIFGQPDNLGSITSVGLVSNKQFPADIKILGATVRFTGFEGDRLDFQLVEVMPLQPFSVTVQTLRY